MGQTSYISLQTLQRNKMKAESEGQRAKNNTAYEMQKRQCSDTENPSSTVSSSHIQKEIFNLLFQNNFIKGTQRNNVHVWISFYIWLTFFFQMLHAELWAASQILIKHTADCGQIFNKAVSWSERKKRKIKTRLFNIRKHKYKTSQIDIVKTFFNILNSDYKQRR